MVEVIKFSGKSQESLRSPIALIFLHSFAIRDSRDLIKIPNLSSSFGEASEVRAVVLGKAEDEPRFCFGNKLGRSEDKEEEFIIGWDNKMFGVETEEGGEGGRTRWRKVKMEEKNIIGVNDLKIILTGFTLISEIRYSFNIQKAPFQN